MANELRDALLRQLDIAWALTDYHLNGLTTAECLWQPAPTGLHVQLRDGLWLADWPDHEGYDLGPASIAWLTWHMVFWWSMVIDHSFGQAQLTHRDVHWPGTAEAVRTRIVQLHSEWEQRVKHLSDANMKDTQHTRWPFAGKPFVDVVSWLNIELAKNAAELGYARFLYATAATEVRR